MDIINSYISKSITNIVSTISKLGTIEFFIVIILFTYTLEYEKLTNQLIMGIIIITCIALPIRYFLFKDRPKKLEHSNVLEKIKASSFPSMHSARFGYMLGLVYFTTKNIQLLLLLSIIYVIIIFHRLYTRKHDIYDILGGILLAFTVIIFITNIKGF